MHFVRFLFSLCFLPLFASGISVQYDDSGNLIHKRSPKGTFSLVYDDQHRLLKAPTDTCEVTYAYDDLGRRISKTVVRDGNVETEFSYYDGNNELAILDAKGKVKQLRVPGPSFHEEIVRSIAIVIEGILYIPILDAQCNVVKLINTQTKEEISYVLDPFGSNLDDLAAITPWIFSGKHYDVETGLVYFGHRYYDPELKQWITPDSLAQSVDFYQYCLSDPLHYIDPDGRFAIAIPIVIWGGATITEALIDAAIVSGAAWLGYEAVKHGNEVMEEHRAKGGKQKDGCPKNNQAQNDQVRGAVKEIERKIGRKLRDDEYERLHRHVSGQGYGYHEIVEEGVELFGRY